MKKTEGNLIMLNVIFAVSLITANMVGAKLWEFGISIGNVALAMSGGSVTYAFTFLCTDVISEMWGKKESSRAVIRGFVAQILIIAIVVLIRYLPTTNEVMQNAYVTLLGQSPWMVLGSMTAYLVSQFTDVTIFHKIKDWQEKIHGQKHRWIRNNGSTMTSQFVDSIVFTVIVFGIGFGFFKQGMGNVVIGIIIGQYLVKLCIAALDTPVFYWLTRGYVKEKVAEKG